MSMLEARRAVVSWAATSMLLVGGVALAHDVIVLVTRGAPAGAIAGTALATVSLACILCAAGSPLAAALAAAARRWPPLAYAIPALIVGAVGWWLLEPTRRLHMGAYVGFAAASAGAAALLVWLARLPRAWNRACAGLVAVGAWVADHALLSPSTYLELHGLAQILWIASVLALGARLRLRWEERPPRHLPLYAAGGLAAAVAATFAVDAVAPRWRAVAIDHTLAVHGQMRAARALVDLDRDGYSPVAWGGDCDDLDAGRHPRAIDPPGGGDANCNGVDPPAEPTEADLGFTPAFGEPRGPGQLVILISVDTLRADAFDPRLMPRMWARARQGIRFERMYASSPSTFTSLPLLVRATDQAPPVAAELGARGVKSSAIYGGVEDLDRKALGFDHVEMARHARGVTARALAHLEEVGPGPRLVWLHYFDPHQPYRAPEPIETPEPVGPMPPGYRDAVAYTDLWLGELFEGLDRMRLSSRAVVLFTADHGEAFGEHGQRNHGRTGYEAVLRVPGFMVGPGIPSGIHPHPVTHRDIVPTVIGAAGFVPPERFGRSWLRLRADPERALHDFVFARSSRYASGREVDVPLGVLVSGHHKLIADLSDRDLAVLYDLRRGEAIDLAPEQPARVRELRRMLALYADLDTFPAFMRPP